MGDPNYTKKTACLKLITSHPFPYHFSRKQGLGIKCRVPFCALFHVKHVKTSVEKGKDGCLKKREVI